MRQRTRSGPVPVNLKRAQRERLITDVKPSLGPVGTWLIPAKCIQQALPSLASHPPSLLFLATILKGYLIYSLFIQVNILF